MIRPPYQNLEFYEPIGAECGGSGRIVYVTKYEPRPKTLGNKVGDYVAKLIDTSINTTKGLLKKLNPERSALGGSSGTGGSGC
jgi:hypothetical protein